MVSGWGKTGVNGKVLTGGCGRSLGRAKAGGPGPQERIKGKVELVLVGNFAPIDRAEVLVRSVELYARITVAKGHRKYGCKDPTGLVPA